jgi:hypothetical protein
MPRPGRLALGTGAIQPVKGQPLAYLLIDRNRDNLRDVRPILSVCHQRRPRPALGYGRGQGR